MLGLTFFFTVASRDSFVRCGGFVDRFRTKWENRRDDPTSLIERIERNNRRRRRKRRPTRRIQRRTKDFGQSTPATTEPNSTGTIDTTRIQNETQSPTEEQDLVDLGSENAISTDSDSLDAIKAGKYDEPPGFWAP